jgi:hypothetical protein
LLNSKLVSNGIDRTWLLQLMKGCVDRLLNVNRAGEIVSIVRRMSGDRLKSRKHWENWHKNCLPVIEAIILQTKEAQARCQFILSVQALPLPLPDATEEEDQAFIEKLYEVIAGLAGRQNYPYHTDLGTLKQEIDYWPLAQCFARLALKLAAVRDYHLESTDKPSLVDYLRLEIVVHLLTKATGPKTVAVEVRRLLEEWSRSNDKMIQAMGMDLARTIQHRDWLVSN